MSVYSTCFSKSLKNILKFSCKKSIRNSRRCCATKPSLPTTENITLPDYLHFHNNFDDTLKLSLVKDMTVIDNFLSCEEEHSILKEIEPYLKRLRYEFDHWDDAIHGYRETEKLKWNSENSLVIQRVRDLAFPPGCPQLGHVHVLDLDAKGLIKPHIDSTRFCGTTIVGLSLLSDSIMRLVHHERSNQVADILLKQRSLYIMRDSARYEYTHEVLGAEQSSFKGQPVPRSRRISVICRNEPSDTKRVA